jgi:lipopolysaccharide/colanic/teichoic acid biosynthesis glycosyltransferase
MPTSRGGAGRSPAMSGRRESAPPAAAVDVGPAPRPRGSLDSGLAVTALVLAAATGPALVLIGEGVAAVAIGLVLFLAVVVHPPAAAYSYLASMPLLVGINRDSLLPAIRPNEAILLVVVVALLTRGAWQLWRRPTLRVRVSWLDVAVLVLGLTASVWPLATMAVRGRAVTGGDLLYASVMPKYVVVFLIVRFAIRTPDQVARCLWLSMSATAVVALIGILQALDLFGVPQLLATYYAPEGIVGLLSINRGTSTVGSSIAMADIMVFHFAVAVAWLVRGQRHHRVLLSAASLFVFGALASGQFSGLIGLLVGVIAVGAVTGRTRRLLLPALPAVALARVLLAPVIDRRLAGFEDGGMPSSWEARRTNLETYFWPHLRGLQNLLLGVRPEARVRAWESWREWVWIESGHTWLLWTGGLPLLAVFFAFVGVAGRVTWRQARARTDAVGAAACAAFTAVAVMAVLMTLDPHLSLRGAADVLFALLALALVGYGPAGRLRGGRVALWLPALPKPPRSRPPSAPAILREGAHQQAGWPLVAKRVIDLVLGAALLLFSSLLLLAVAVAVRLDSPGPALFRQTRIGRDGQPFVMFKFRSMIADADESLHERYVTQLLHSPDDGTHRGQLPRRGHQPEYKLETDPRITRVGRFIRASSLDELPQLLNVLKGDMSLVGPRPDLPYATALYDPWQRRRLQVLPGMTGLWQVSGRGELAPTDMLRLDVEYADGWTLWLDLRILLLTVPAVLGRVGSS